MFIDELSEISNKLPQPLNVIVLKSNGKNFLGNGIITEDKITIRWVEEQLNKIEVKISDIEVDQFGGFNVRHFGISYTFEIVVPLLRSDLVILKRKI